MTVFLRAIESEEKAAALFAFIHDPQAAAGKTRFDVDPASFSRVPRSPFAYWVSERVRGLFAELPAFEGEGRTARLGASSKNDFRFLRAKWEVPISSWSLVSGTSDWIPFAKGGAYSPYYADLHLVILWAHRAIEIEAELLSKFPYLGNSAEFVLHRNCQQFRPGLTWPPRTQSGLALRAMPAGCIFASKGPAAFVSNDASEDLLALLAAVNSQSFRSLVEIQMAFGSYEVGVVQRTPVPHLTPNDQSTLATLAHRAWSLKRSLDTRTETSHAFILPALLQVTGPTLAARATDWAERIRSAEAELASIQAEIDARCFDLYGIDEVDRRAITEGFGAAGDSQDAEDVGSPDDDSEQDDVGDSTVDATSLSAELVAWTVGTAFGRFDVRLATGERQPPPEPDPFDPLPVCSPGMLTGDDGLPLTAPPLDYPLAFPADGVLVDDPGHAHDLTTRAREVFGVVFGADADERWQEASALVEARGNDLRRWLAREFFTMHLRAYSRSRRRAPIFWQLATPSATHSVWLYYHRFTRDTLFTVQNDYVVPKLRHEERKLTGLRQAAGPNPTASGRKEIAEQEAFVEELRALREEVARVAPLWNPDLNDGVIINFAPLWRLVPHNKAWQRELKACWDKLAAGAYDWAHLAMHLWPERVVPKCTTDRSLAIAHDLEDALWSEGPDGKWRAWDLEPGVLERLVAERTSTAVKSALDSLESAAAPTAKASRHRADRESA